MKPRVISGCLTAVPHVSPRMHAQHHSRSLLAWVYMPLNHGATCTCVDSETCYVRQTALTVADEAVILQLSLTL